MGKDRSTHCWTCGRPRGIAHRRESWSLDLTPLIPQTGNPDHKPAQITNDLICHTGIYRNGGTNSDTHLCDDCLAIGLRALKTRIDILLGLLSADIDLHTQIAALTQRVARLQHRLGNICFDHNRMQDRLKQLLAHAENHGVDDPDTLQAARWEVGRGHVRGELD